MKETRYRRVEEKLHESAGLAVEERWIDLPRVGTRARALLAGEGTPTLFLTGGPDGGGSSWSYGAARLDGIRSVLLDRPGTGLSAPPREVLTAETLPSYVADLTVDVLDALEIERAVLVGCSFGGYSALRSAIAYPDRVTGVYLAGCPAFVPGWAAPGFFTLLRTPVLGKAFLRLPANRSGARLSLRLLGHQRGLTAKRLPSELIDWVTAWQRDTDTMRHDAAMIRAAGSWLGGFEKRLDLTAEDLAAVHAPTHVLVGTDDVVGREHVANELARLLGDATVEVWQDAGHLPWYDQPEEFAKSVMRFVSSVG